MRPGTLLRWHALKHILKSEISEIEDGSSIFDIGSYDGEISYNLKRIFQNLEFVIVDIDKSGLQLAAEKGLDTLYTSALNLPVKDNKVDFILCLDLIEHVKEDNALIKEISRVLKKHGKVILTTPMQNGVSFPFLSRKKSKTINKNWGHVRKGYSLENIVKLFRNNDLMIVKISKYFNFFSRLVYRFNHLPRIPLKGKGLLYRMIIRLEPYIKNGAEEHIIVCKKR
ncbi:class I SAM-dependent methyltransferase [Patescibacteria group bacterium]|nr:class I SAM-dependent methyltransferase [Patescibacteria group bacterium]